MRHGLGVAYEPDGARLQATWVHDLIEGEAMYFPAVTMSKAKKREKDGPENRIYRNGLLVRVVKESEMKGS